MKKIYSILILIFVFCSSTTVFCESEFAPIPIIMYGPDTSLTLGAMGVFLFKDPSRPDAKKDQIMADAKYSLKNQYDLHMEYKKYFINRFENEGKIVYSVFPTDYYGIGADTSENNEESFTPKEIKVEEALMYTLPSNISFGPVYRFKHYSIMKSKEEGLLESDLHGKSEPTIISMIGGIARYDTRDSVFYPKNGLFLSTDLTLNNKIIGASENSYNITLDYRQYMTVYKQRYIIGWQVIAISQGGDVPFSLLEGTGGDKLLRGYSEARYIDKCKMGWQIEFRYPFTFFDSISILNRFSGTVFAGLATVAPALDSIEVDTIKYAYGTGLRYAVIKDEMLNIRFDFTLNRENMFNFYTNFEEAF